MASENRNAARSHRQASPISASGHNVSFKRRQALEFLFPAFRKEDKIVGFHDATRHATLRILSYLILSPAAKKIPGWRASLLYCPRSSVAVSDSGRARPRHRREARRLRCLPCTLATPFPPAGIAVPLRLATNPAWLPRNSLSHAITEETQPRACSLNLSVNPSGRLTPRPYLCARTDTGRRRPASSTCERWRSIWPRSSARRRTRSTAPSTLRWARAGTATGARASTTGRF